MRTMYGTTEWKRSQVWPGAVTTSARLRSDDGHRWVILRVVKHGSQWDADMLDEDTSQVLWKRARFETRAMAMGVAEAALDTVTVGASA